MIRRRVAGALILSILCSAGVAAGQAGGESAAVQEARRRYDLGTQHAEQGDWALALAEFERVYALLDGHPNRELVVYNLARANEELGRHRQAVAHYERYLAETPADAPNRDEAQRHLSELRLRLQLQGGFSPSPFGLVIAGAGAAAAIAGGIVGGLALAQDGDARATCEGTRCTPEAFAAIGEAHTLANVADALLWGGLAVAAAGAVLTFVLGESGETSAAAACDAEGCSAVLRGSL